MQKFRRFLLFATQLLTILAIAGIVSRPSIANGNRRNYIVILDTSGSMNTTNENGVSRIDRAITQIEELSSLQKQGHTISLLTVSDTANIVLQDCSSPAELKSALSKINCTNGVLTLSGAVSLAEKIASESDLTSVIFFTDSDYEAGADIEVVNVNANEWNAHIVEVSYTSIKTPVTKVNTNGGKSTTYQTTGTEFTGLIYSENKGASFTVGLKVDGKITDVKELTCQANTTTEVIFTEDGIKNFDTAEIYLIASDGLSIDNSYSICREQDANAKVLLKSDNPLYLEASLSVLDSCTVTTIATTEDTPSGYDLYIFDCCTPDSLPEEGSVLIINSSANGMVNLKKEVYSTATLSKAVASDLSKRLQDVTLDMNFSDIYVSSYTPIVYGSGWTGLMYCNEDCVFAARQLNTGLTQMVLSFDLHNSNLPMLSEFVYLMRNIVKSSVPTILYETDVELGQSINFAVLPSTTEFYLQDPEGSIISLAISDSTITYTPNKAGVYTVIEKNPTGGAYADFFVHLSEKESVTTAPGVLSLSLSQISLDENGNAVVEERTDLKPALSPLWYWFALAALIFLIIEWEVYYYEQY